MNYKAGFQVITVMSYRVRLVEGSKCVWFRSMIVGWLKTTQEQADFRTWFSLN